MNGDSAPSAPPIDLLQMYYLQVLLHSRSITASKCISNLAQIQPLRLHTHGLQVHLQTHLPTASKLIRSWPPKCISKLVRSRPASASLSTQFGHVQVNLELLKHTVCSLARLLCVDGLLFRLVDIKILIYIATLAHWWEYKLNTWGLKIV